MANPKVARATAKRFMTQALLEADTFVAEGRAKDVDMDHLRELKEKFVTSCNTYIDSIPQDEITEEIEMISRTTSVSSVQYTVKLCWR